MSSGSEQASGRDHLLEGRQHLRAIVSRLRPGARQMSCHSSLTTLVALVSLLLASAPAGAAQWSTPATVSAPHDAISDLRLASGPAGELLSWKFNELLASSGTYGPAMAGYAVASAGGPFGPVRLLPRRDAGGTLVSLGGGGRLAQLILPPSDVNRSNAEVAMGSVRGSFGAPRPVRGAHVSSQRAVLAGNAHGELLLVWIAADRLGGHRVVWAATAPASGRFSRPQVVASAAQAERVAGAVGPQGEMVIAFPSKYGRMLARVRRRGQPWGALQTLGPAAGGTENDVTPFVGRDGRVIVAWYETQLCEGGCMGPGFTRVAVQPAGRTRFLRAQLLERDAIGPEGAPSGMSLAPIVLAAGARAPIVVFLGRAATSSSTTPLNVGSVKVAYARGLGFSKPQTVSPADQQANGIAAAAGPDRMIVSWIRQDPPGYFGGTVFAAITDARSGLLGASEQVSPSERVLGAVVAYNWAAGSLGGAGAQWVAAWTARLATANVVRSASG
jgi:hypothetical protein